VVISWFCDSGSEGGVTSHGSGEPKNNQQITIVFNQLIDCCLMCNGLMLMMYNLYDYLDARSCQANEQ
jgi:hypothetical protein